MLLLVFYICALLSSVWVHSAAALSVRSGRNELGDVIQKRSADDENGLTNGKAPPRLVFLERKHPLYELVPPAAPEELMYCRYLLSIWSRDLNTRKRDFTQSVRLPLSAQQAGKPLYLTMIWYRVHRPGALVRDQDPIRDLVKAEVKRAPPWWNDTNLYTVDDWFRTLMEPEEQAKDQSSLPYPVEGYPDMRPTSSARLQGRIDDEHFGLSYALVRRNPNSISPESLQGGRWLDDKDLPDLLDDIDIL
ncbi:MAG: hypothetical protein M1837_007363 [Sclerophora amabilis]|nr:MAG: hypothetical protein M1837_007363 [Sclerophora amabilis]